MSDVTEGNRQGRDFVHLHIHTGYGLLGGACGAWYASIVGLGATGTGVTGIFGILLHLHMPLQYIFMMAISFGVSFAVTWVIWSPEEVKA